MKRNFGILVVAALLMASFSTGAAAQPDPPDRMENRELPDSVANMKLGTSRQLSGLTEEYLTRSAFEQPGTEQVIIRLRMESVAEYDDDRSSARKQHKSRIESEQAAFLERVQSIDPTARVLGSVQLVLNAVFVEIDASALPAIAEDPDVLKITPVGNYELVLSETVPYIGATAVHSLGLDGTGVRVAVLDTGLDYTHANLGGSGDPADYLANDPTIIEPGTFPTSKVVGGFDFVGAVWPFGPLGSDPDPLDVGGHGTHVGDIIGGQNGTAPGVDLYAVKVCSDVATACSGVALILGMEFAVDPDGDGNPEDRVDIVNMSLGADYGQPFDDDLSLAVDNATALGVLTVAASGNGGDKPYITGSPAAAETAISVAQTHVPSAFLPQYEITAPASISGFYNAVFQPWSSPLATIIEAPVQYADGAGGNLDGCAPFPAGSLSGLIVLVDRGGCFFTTKIFNVGNAGGEIGIIGLVAPGDPFPGGFGDPGGPITIPGFMIREVDSDTIKGELLAGVVARFDPTVGISLISSVVSSSSRGPRGQENSIKPDIAAPGASVSAQVGTGTGETPFGGTSGATPMVTGSAALLLQARGEEFDDDLIADGDDDDEKEREDFEGDGLSPLEVKALLMNTAETQIINNLPNTALAAISRIGGGEVRVDRAVASPIAAWDDDSPSGALSFGFIDVADGTVELTRKVRVVNYSDDEIELDIIPSFRFNDDIANGAVTISAPSSIEVEGGEDATFKVTLTINGSLLRNNLMNSGSQGANPGPLTANEYDGYLILDDGENPIHLAWQVLPRKAARVDPARDELEFNGGFVDVIGLKNKGVGTAQNDAYSLLATSEDIPSGGPGAQAPTPDLAAVGINTFPVPAGFCSANPSFIWAFAAASHERQTHLLPVSYQFWLDTNQDGISDFVVLNRDGTFSGVDDGRQFSWAFDLSDGSASAFFFAEHSMNTGNTALYICGEQIGLTGTDMLSTNVDMFVIAQDFYFGGPGDFIGDLTVTPLGEQYFGLPNDVAGNSNDPAGLTVIDFGPFPGNSPELGLMLFTNGDRGSSSRGGATEETEALLFLIDSTGEPPDPEHQDDEDDENDGDDGEEEDD